jgi:hypothetical protein
MARQEGALVLTPQVMLALGITPDKIAQVKEQVYMAETGSKTLTPEIESILQSLGVKIEKNPETFGTLAIFQGVKFGKSPWAKDKGGMVFQIAPKASKAFQPAELVAMIEATILAMRENVAKGEKAVEYLKTLI